MGFEREDIEVVFFSREKLTALLPVPAIDAHKYSRGTVTIIAGSANYPGAACLAAAAAQRAGAGYTCVVTESTNVKLIQGYRASFVVRSWADMTPDDLAESTSAHPCAYVLGCGFDPKSDTTARLVLAVADRANAPLVVDGGGLSAVATNKGSRLLQRRSLAGLPTILTPHAGEAMRLAEAVNLVDFASRTPERQAQSLAKMYGSIVVLKGSDTYISDGWNVLVVDCGTPALAKAGTGDVLAGIIGSLLAQGLDPFDAAVLGATLHAQAGVAAADEFTEICVTPEDVVDAIPQAVCAVAAGLSDVCLAPTLGQAHEPALEQTTHSAHSASDQAQAVVCDGVEREKPGRESDLGNSDISSTGEIEHPHVRHANGESN